MDDRASENWQLGQPRPTLVCGIAGVFDAAGVDHRSVSRMVEKLVHRGPDSCGHSNGDGYAFGMRRLAILDLVSGDQPIANDDGSIRIVFNGEIYNYRDLRTKLEGKGLRFRTKSDTEVILRGYEAWGRDVVERLAGMFAFAIYDARSERLFLARDRFGEKPLFYWHEDQRFAFSSELTSLVSHPLVPRELDLDSLKYYLHVGYPAPPMTLFRGLLQVPAGHWLEFDGTQVTLGRYFIAERKIDSAIGEVEAAEELRRRLLLAVRRQIESDVPVGAFLSGGIDSSTVAAAMQHVVARPIDTFTVKFQHAPYDESAIAREVSDYLGTVHHEIFIANASFHGDDVTRIVRAVGQPFADSSAIPTYLLSKEVRKSIKVALSGDGGDEMFAGYPQLRWVQYVDSLAAVFGRRGGAALHRIIRAATRRAPFLTGLRRIERAFAAASLPRSQRVWRLAPLFDIEEMGHLLRDFIQVNDFPFKLLDDRVDSYPGSRLRQAMRHRMEFALTEDMLVKVDRMSMAASLEVRAPMLDVEVADFALSLPDNLLVRGGEQKFLLRKAAQPWLPSSVFSHPKKGFSIPMHEFHNASYAAIAKDLLLSKHARIRELMIPMALEKILANGLASRLDRADVSVYRSTHQLWSLVQLAAWLEEFRPSLRSNQQHGVSDA